MCGGTGSVVLRRVRYGAGATAVLKLPSLVTLVGGVPRLAPPSFRAVLPNRDVGSALDTETRTRLGNCVKLGSDSGRYRCAALNAEDAPSDRPQYSFPTKTPDPMQPRQRLAVPYTSSSSHDQSSK